MSITCTRCEGTGFLNLHLIDDSVMDSLVEERAYEPEITFETAVLTFVREHPEFSDVSVCDCCGDGEGWFGVPGEHYNSEDPQGPDGPYAGNGGLCQCH